MVRGRGYCPGHCSGAIAVALDMAIVVDAATATAPRGPFGWRRTLLDWCRTLLDWRHAPCRWGGAPHRCAPLIAG